MLQAASCKLRANANGAGNDTTRQDKTVENRTIITSPSSFPTQECGNLARSINVTLFLLLLFLLLFYFVVVCVLLSMQMPMQATSHHSTAPRYHLLHAASKTPAGMPASMYMPARTGELSLQTPMRRQYMLSFTVPRTPRRAGITTGITTGITILTASPFPLPPR